MLCYAMLYKLCLNHNKSHHVLYSNKEFVIFDNIYRSAYNLKEEEDEKKSHISLLTFGIAALIISSFRKWYFTFYFKIDAHTVGSCP